MNAVRVLLVSLLAWSAATVTAQTCPFNIPVKTLAPHTVNGYSWGNPIRPQGDACVGYIAVEPTNASAWYVGGFNGLYQTKTNGLFWAKPLSGNVGALLLWPGDGVNPQLVYAGIANKLYLSRDKGANWTLIQTFPATVTSLLVAESKLFVGLGWSNHVDPTGVYVSNLGGGLMTFKPFGAGYTGLIVWTLSYDDASNVLYAGTEIFDHPQPYKPPFFRSANGGGNWTNVNQFGALPWHVVDSAVRPNDGYLYALTEGAGLYRSATMGSSWTVPINSQALGLSLLMDPQLPTRLYAGRHEAGTVNGGLFLSNDGGGTFANIGLLDVTVADMALNGNGSKIYAAAYASGIYTANVP
ncbi:MAG TPA: hypothetical protein VF432_30475 [Thermoanaerobaculia bacterium]